jgi:hypothetical protein
MLDRVALRIMKDIIAKMGCFVKMATAFLSRASPVRTAIVHSVLRVSVSTTFVVKYLAAHVKTVFLAKLECPAFKPSLIMVPIAILLKRPVKLMPEKAAI